MHWKHQACSITPQVLLLALLTVTAVLVTGNPLSWRSIQINSTSEISDDPGWTELITWSNETLADTPVLLTNGRNHSLPRPQLTNEELANQTFREFENRTLKELEQLKKNYSHLFYEVDGSMKDDKESARHLPHIVDKTLRLLNLNQVVSEVETSVMSKVSCTACKAGVGLLLHYIRAGKTTDEIIKMSFQFCVSLKIQSPRVCDGITQLFGGEVVFVLKRITIGPDEICSFVIGDACGDIYNPTHEWEVVFPPVPKPSSPPIQLPTEPGTTSFKVLQLSDTHFDPYYEEGTNAACNEPLCCRLTNGPAASEADRAGKWGDYRKCDTPKRTIDHMFQHISSTHPDIDYILWTGDLPPHDIWNQTQEENLKIIKETVGQMTTLFPNVPIFPALGNHESSPVNSFPPPFIQKDHAINWLYDEIDKHWRHWLPTSVSRTVRRGAYYSVLVRPGFRIISLNMNYCNNKNWWLLLNSTDPAKELQWFIYELQSAEFNQEKVHVIGHIPPGHPDCLKVWSRNYYSIVTRYESTITAQFFGHTHFDEFELFYDPKNMSRAVSVSYISPSVTPFTNLNPGYRIYYVDGDREHSSRTVLDHETWVMNLKEANLYGYPIWYKMYSARAAYQMSSLLPTDWDALITKLTENEESFELYYKHYWKNSPVKPVCDLECKKRMICDLRSGRSHDRKTFCQEIESRIDAKNPTGWKAWINKGISISNETTTMESDQESNDSITLLDLLNNNENEPDEGSTEANVTTQRTEQKAKIENELEPVKTPDNKDSLSSNSKSISTLTCPLIILISSSLSFYLFIIF